MTQTTGTGVGAGTRTGPVFWLDKPTHESTEPTDAASTDPEAARERFEGARDAALAELRSEQSQAAAAVGAAGEDVLATHESFLTDPALEERVDAEIAAGAPPARAIATAIGDWIEVFEDQGGRTAARADDLRDLRGRLLRALAGDTDRSIRDVPDGAVVLTTRLSPSDAALLDPDHVAGIACVHGSTGGHAAILARAAGVPMVVDTGPGLHQLPAGRAVTVDAGRGLVHDHSDERSQDVETPKAEAREGTQSAPDAPVRTASGRVIRVGANVGSGTEAELAASTGADGIVLFRSEVLAYQHGGTPDTETQAAAYRRALDAFPDEQVTIRTFDFGGDKPRPAHGGPAGPDGTDAVTGLDADSRGPDGSALGGSPQTAGGDRRGIERSLATPDAFDAQLRALCRASEHGDGSLVVLLPHVTRVEQVVATRERLETVATQEGVTPPRLGAMVETPAAVVLAPDLAEVADCLSLGTNDLLAGLRGAPRDADIDPDPMTPTFLRSLVRTTDAALDEEIPLSCCGELARNPAWARRFVALGVDALGVPPRDIAQTRDAIAELDVADLRERVRATAEVSTNSEVRRRLSGSEHG